MVPSTTGAANAVIQTLPELKNKFDGLSIRVPVITGSLIDVTALLKKKVTVKQVNNAFIAASQNPLYKGIIGVTKDPIVSTDIIGTTLSAIVDLGTTKVVGGDLVKVLAWYDNEYGYSCRLVEMVEMLKV
jgi:glyceraldehyde 3-phosphate dehydrogenase